MVGIPLRAGGCHTCRRRKVKCDRTKPHCERCARSGRQCEGYEAYAVFLNRTPNGLQRRKRLEEAVISLSTPTSENDFQAPRESHFEQPKNQALIKFRAPSTTPAPLTFYSLTQSLSLNELEDGQIFHAFVESFFSKRVPTVKYQLTRHWLQVVSDLQNPGTALTTSLKALSYGHIGTLHRDDNLVFKGRVAYDKALVELQKVLHDLSDTTLGACKTLAVYEMLVETKENDPLAKASHHQRGMESLIYHRGPGTNDSELFNCLLENARESSVSLALLEGGYSYFERPEWVSNGSDFSSRMLLLGAKAANLHYDVAQLLRPNSARAKSIRSGPAQILLHRCLEISLSLSTWWQDLLNTRTTQMYWEEKSLSTTHTGREPLPYGFNSFYEADLITKYWCGVILLRWIPRTLKDAFGEEAPPTGFEALAEEIHLALEQPDLRQTARNILRSIPYFLQEEMGVHGANRVTFAFRMAIPVLEDGDFEFDSIEREWIARLRNSFVTLKGIPLQKVQARCFSVDPTVLSVLPSF